MKPINHPWQKLSETLLQKTVVFDLWKQRMRFPDGVTEDDFYFIKCPDWTNVVPITDNGEIVLVRQFRHGTLTPSLETPGGLIDAGEDDIPLAAKRELEEETGYVAKKLLPLGPLHPNPALLNNRCHFFLGVGCKKEKALALESSEDITVEVIPLKELAERIRAGEFTHSLFYSALLLALVYYPEEVSDFWVK